MSRAIRIHAPGGPEALCWDEVSVPSPGPGEALIEHTAVGLNFIDTYHRSGLYPLSALPHGIGMEAAGVVREVGPGVHEVRPGDRVAYAAGPPGAYAEARVIRADRLIPLPKGIDDRQAAAMMLRGMTVEYLVRRAFHVQEGMTVLWHAAAGGVGLIACQWLKSLGARVIGTVGSAEKAEIARAHGCDHPLLYNQEDVAARVRELTGGKGVAVVYDGVGKATFEASLGSLAKRGMFVGFGNASGPPGSFDMLELARRGSLFMTRPTLMDYTESREELLQSAQSVFRMVEMGAVQIQVRQTWPLEQAAEAHRALEERRTIGSSVLLP